MGRRESSGATRWYVSLKVICGCLSVLLALASVESMTMDVDNEDQQCVIISASKGSTINANYEILGFPIGTMVVLRHKGDGKLFYRREGLPEDYFTVPAPEAGDYELCFINGKMDVISSLRNKDVENEDRLVGLDALIKEKREKLKQEEKEAARFFSDDGFLYSNMMEVDDSFEIMSDDDGSWYPKDSALKTFGFGLRLGENLEDIKEMSEVPREDREMARFLKEEADVLVQTLSAFNDHESYMRGREEYHRENVKQTSTRLMWCTFIEAAVLIWVSWSQLSYIRRFFETKRVL